MQHLQKCLVQVKRTAQAFKAGRKGENRSAVACYGLRTGMFARVRNHILGAMIIGCLRQACATQIGDIYILGPGSFHAGTHEKIRYAPTTKPHEKLTANVTLSVA